MNKIVGIQFKKYGKVYNFDSGHFVLKKGDNVLAETEQGLALGVVCTAPIKCDENFPERTLKKISRLATYKDIERSEKNCNLERGFYAFCYEKILWIDIC